VSHTRLSCCIPLCSHLTETRGSHFSRFVFCSSGLCPLKRWTQARPVPLAPRLFFLPLHRDQWVCRPIRTSLRPPTFLTRTFPELPTSELTDAPLLLGLLPLLGGSRCFFQTRPSTSSTLPPDASPTSFARLSFLLYPIPFSPVAGLSPRLRYSNARSVSGLLERATAPPSWQATVVSKSLLVFVTSK